MCCRCPFHRAQSRGALLYRAGGKTCAELQRAPKARRAHRVLVHGVARALGDVGAEELRANRAISPAMPASIMVIAMSLARAKTLAAAPPARKLATICVVTSLGQAETPSATMPWSPANSSRRAGIGGGLQRPCAPGDLQRQLFDAAERSGRLGLEVDCSLHRLQMGGVERPRSCSRSACTADCSVVIVTACLYQAALPCGFVRSAL